MKTKAWHRTIGSWAGIFFIPLGILNIISNQASIFWLLGSFFVYTLITLSVTVGYHRLFNHAVFVCPRIWQWIFGIVGCASLNGSPFHWSVVHSNHHLYSDTDKDPHETSWRYYFRFKDRTKMKVTKADLRLSRDPMHQLFMHHSLTICICVMLSTVLFGLNSFLFLFAIPVSASLITSGLHTIFAHRSLLPYKNGIPQNHWLLEFIIPLSGEWLHKEHHDKAGRSSFCTRPHYFDLGGILINFIRLDKK